VWTTVLDVVVNNILIMFGMKLNFSSILVVYYDEIKRDLKRTLTKIIHECRCNDPCSCLLRSDKGRGKEETYMNVGAIFCLL